MAKKKKAAAPAQAQKPAEQKAKEQKGEKIIDQLFGTLEQEPDIESDIAELGGETAEPPKKAEKTEEK